MPGFPCGNDPRVQLIPGDRAAVANFRAFLTARAEEKTTVSDLDAARAALKPFEIISGFVGRLEAFEAAVRANERAGAEVRRLGAPDPAPEPMSEERAAQLLAPLEAKARAIREQLDAKRRAEVLREAADRLDESERLRNLTDDHMHDVNAAANELRRMADEEPTK